VCTIQCYSDEFAQTSHNAHWAISSLDTRQRKKYTPDPTKGIEVYVDADFAGGWDPGDAMNTDNVYSQTGYVIRYAGCPIY
jgi:hypothetical protein